ncbi:hypothetical protein BJX66DRAFT_342579 [Aspergillus keveii]|uniref:NAD-dependent epimerase/dehydratase domain-containing protein n=1 Tax=Aspergillus keveii TaxID=714993 RepID=A0ABR4FRT8_9EURO
MAKKKILLTGATVAVQFISALIASQAASVKNASISVLVRGEEQARVLQEKGLRTINFKGFDDDSTIKKAASEHDIVINTASGFEAGLAASLIRGLGDRKNALGVDVHYIHTSGTTNYANSPTLNLYQGYAAATISDKATTQVVSTLRQLNEASPYAQRTTDLTVLAVGKEAGVNTHIITIPMLFGFGTGFFRKLSGQLPILMDEALRARQVWIVGDGVGVKQHIHVEDAAAVYELVLKRVLEGLDVPSGKEGIMFVENGSHSWNEAGEALAKAGKSLGALDTEQVKRLTLEEAAKTLGIDDINYVEVAYASTSRVSAETARSFKWQPKWPKGSIWEFIEPEWRAVLEERK